MPAVALAVLGALVGLLHIRSSSRLLNAARHEEPDAPSGFPIQLYVVGAVVGSTTAAMLPHVGEPIDSAALVVVASLTLLQGPLDLMTSRLSRPVTLLALVTLLVATVVDGVVTDPGRVGISILVSIAVVAVFVVLHRRSPASLGWGDVLLVAPLALAVATVAVERVAWWQLAAAVSGSAHALMARVRPRRQTIPFGPHLLVSAWLIVLASV